MTRAFVFATRALMVGCALCAARHCVAAERVHLRNGFTLECDRHETTSEGRVELVIDTLNRMEVDRSAILSVETLDASTASHVPMPASSASTAQGAHPLVPRASSENGTSVDLAALVASAGTARNINVDLLHSIVLAESGGRTHAVSRTEAQGLMQLMPSTARSMRVDDSFAPEQNLRGGAAYLDHLLTRYGNNLVLALAAYNAGPGAVDRYHGVPPYRETIAYVSRIVREFNRRTLAQQRRTALVMGAKLP